MATTSSQTRSSSVSTPTLWDVFLSFRGLDTRHKFTNDLHTALDRHGVRTFMDNPELHTGEVILEALLEAIKESKTYIVVFSEEYASSRWCLEELEEIYNFHKTMKRLIVPVFYKVDPSVVRHQTGSFKKAFEKHQTRFDVGKVEKWRLTLEHVAGLSGRTISAERSEAEIGNEIVEIVNIILRETNCKNLHVADYPVGLNSRLRDITSLFTGGKGVVRIGIYGMGGVGKTTLAKALYNQLLLDSFQGVCFLENVREKSGTTEGSKSLQQKLINDFLKSKNKYEVPSVGEGTKFIRERFCSTKVLLFLDDVDNLAQYESLVGTFASGSVVIITSRDQNLLNTVEIELRYQYRANELDEAESLTLFTHYAFRISKPSKTLMALSKDILRLAGGLPLALIVFGAYLCTRSEEGWKSYIEKLQRDPDYTVEQKLVISLDALERDDPMLKQMFLDIACFFNGWEKEAVVKIMETYFFSAHHKIDILEEKCLLTVNNDDELRMHDLLRDMGRNVARNNSPDEPGKHSRLWSSKNIGDVLKKNKGTEAIEGIFHNMAEIEASHFTESYKAETFMRISKLRFLQLNCVLLTGNFECAFENLRWFRWDSCPLERLPLGFHPEKLVILELPFSEIKNLWGLNVVFENLKTLDMSNSVLLTSTPDFNMLPCLETLNLRGCEKLKEIHKSIGSLARLVSLDLSGCVNLRRLPDKICDLRALNNLNIYHCSGLKALPKEFGNIKSLKELIGNGLTLSKLPDSIGRLHELVHLSIGQSNNIKTLPHNICNLRSLEVLHIAFCSRLEEIPLELGNVISLKTIRLWGLNISTLPISIGYLCHLVELDLSCNSHLETLPDSICCLRALEVLHICECISLQALPEGLGNLKSLRNLRLVGLTVSELPSSIGSLSKLVEIHLNENENLKSLPDTICNLRSLEILDVSKCGKLEMFPDKLCKITTLKDLNAVYATLLKELPGISQLSNLKSLDLTGCCNLLSVAELPSNLECITAGDCTSIERLPNLSNLKQLKMLDLSYCTGLTEVQGFKELTSLEKFILTRCDSSLLACIFTKSFFQTFSGFGHKIKIFTDELPDWISPSDNLEESSTVSLDLLPNVSHNFSVMQETSACTEEFLDCISESWYLEESTVPLDLLPNISQDFLQMYEINTDREEFLDCITESFNLEESVVSLSLLPNGSRDSLEMHETNTDTEEFPDWISESCYSEEPIVLSIDFLSHNIWGLHETKTYPEEFPDNITESSYLPMLQSKMFSNLLPNASHNFLGMILCFMPGTSRIMYAVKSNTSDVMYSSEDYDRFREIVMIIVPRSIFAVRDGDDRIELTSDKEIILGIYPLYKPENNLESHNN